MITKDGWKLVDVDNNTVHFGATYTDFRGQPHVIEGGSPPHKLGSTGRIWTNVGEFFPGVCNLTWVEEA